MLNRDSNALWEAHIARQRPPAVRRWHGLALALTGALAAAASAFVAALFLLPAAMVFHVAAAVTVDRTEEVRGYPSPVNDWVPLVRAGAFV